LIRNERHALIVVGTSYKLAPAGGISQTYSCWEYKTSRWMEWSFNYSNSMG